MIARAWLIVVLTAAASCGRKEKPVVPIACVPSALTAEEHRRSQALRAALSVRVSSVEEQHDGYRYRYDDGASALVELAEWVPMERKCCPFLNFEVRWDSGEPGPALTLTGPEGVKGFLQAEMPELPAKR